MKPIAMKCSEEQFYQIKPILEENKIVVSNIGPFTRYPYLSNNLDDILGRVSNIMPNRITDNRRTVFSFWDQDTFLEYCGIETEPKHIPTAMKCTMEQFKSIEPILLDHGKQIHHITNDFQYRCYLINYHDMGITNLQKDSFYIDEAKIVYGTWDGDIFLKNCGIKVKQTKQKEMKTYKINVSEIIKIHKIACSEWKSIIKNQYIKNLDEDLCYTFNQDEVDVMFKAATKVQIPLLEFVFGKQTKEIEWDKIKTGSKVMIKHSGNHCSGIDDTDLSQPVDVVFWKTPHFINGTGLFQPTGSYFNYCTFHQNGKYVLFSSHNGVDFVTEVVEY